MNEQPLSRQDCLAAIKRFTALGLAYTVVPLLSVPWKGNIWLSQLEHETLNDTYNVGIRGVARDTGGLSAFGIKCEYDWNMQIPMRETPAYGFLRDTATLCFETTDTAVFWFRSDKGITVDEQLDERIAPPPLQGAQLISQSGALAWGVLQDSWGRSGRVDQLGDEVLDVRKFPALMDALKWSGRFQAIVSDDYRLQYYSISGAPLI
jgi:hypothetical protein